MLDDESVTFKPPNKFTAWSQMRFLASLGNLSSGNQCSKNPSKMGEIQQQWKVGVEMDQNEQRNHEKPRLKHETWGKHGKNLIKR